MEYYSFTEHYWGFPITFSAEYEIVENKVDFTFYIECEIGSGRHMHAGTRAIYKFPIKTFSRKNSFRIFDPDEFLDLEVPDQSLHKEAEKIRRRGRKRFTLLILRHHHTI